MTAAAEAAPSVGDLVRVRGQQWVVSAASTSSQPKDELATAEVPGATLVTLTRVSDDYWDDPQTRDAYGWSDLDPEIGHHNTKIGTRWTVSPAARFELLDLLLEENHRRHALETGDNAP